jgi:hypothetical protein
MLTFIGIALYLAIGYIFVCLADANEDGVWDQVKVILFWPILAIAFIMCFIYFGWKELYKKCIKKNK